MTERSKQDKLEALRRQLGLKTCAQITPQENRPDSPHTAPDSSGEPPASGHLDLRSLSARLGLMSGTQLARTRDDDEEQRLSGSFEIDKIMPGSFVGEDEDRFFLLRREFPLSYAQGNLPLSTALECVSEHIALSAADPELAAFDPRTTLFVDTETTGLAGGAGTVAFLIGIGYFTEDTFCVEQCFLGDYDQEESMLRYLADRFSGFNTVAGYNSKSFDLPLLRTRFIQNRIPFRLDGVKHLDLVHAARRFWKRRLADCSLGNIEREVLGFRRHGDVPSHLIPQLWLDYLYSRDARPLEGVFYHHLMDILSLVTLTGWLSQCLAQPEGSGFDHIEDRLSLVRLHFRQKNYDEVLRHGRAFLEADERSPLRRECLEMIALACKRRQRWLDMQEALEHLIDEFPSDLTARLELAKHHEHRTRDLFTAERLCAEALDRLEIRSALARDTGIPDPTLEAFRRRLQRLRRKLGKNNPLLDD